MKDIMKAGKLYQSPIVVSVLFANEDVITTSGEPVLAGTDASLQWNDNWNLVGGGN